MAARDLNHSEVWTIMFYASSNLRGWPMRLFDWNPACCIIFRICPLTLVHDEIPNIQDVFLWIKHPTCLWATRFFHKNLEIYCISICLRYNVLLAFGLLVLRFSFLGFSSFLGGQLGSPPLSFVLISLFPLLAFLLLAFALWENMLSAVIFLRCSLFPFLILAVLAFPLISFELLAIAMKADAHH